MKLRKLTDGGYSVRMDSREALRLAAVLGSITEHDSGFDPETYSVVTDMLTRLADGIEENYPNQSWPPTLTAILREEGVAFPDRLIADDWPRKRSR